MNKPNFPIIVLFLFAKGIVAQTLTCQNTCPKPGQVFSMRTSSPAVSTPGKNQLWNYANIKNVSPAPFYISYDAAGSAPNNSLYPQANMMMSDGNSTVFLSTGSNGIKNIYPSTQTVTADPFVLPLPFAYGDTLYNFSAITTVSGNNTVVTNLSDAFYAHATGTLILPFGTYNDVLSIKFQRSESSTTNGVPDSFILNSTAYYFYSASVSQYLMYSLWRSDSKQTDYFPYTEILEKTVTGVPTILSNSDEVIACPNPARDQLMVRFPNALSKLTIRNIMGQEVYRNDHFQNEDVIDISELGNGVYVLGILVNGIEVNRKIIVDK